MLLHTLAVALSFGLALEGLASPLQYSKREVPITHTIHERHTSSMGQRWMKRDKLSSTAVLPMRIGLKQSNLDLGHTRLMEM